jgi:hypothetical protein
MSSNDKPVYSQRLAVSLIRKALNALSLAEAEMLAPTHPKTQLGRFRKYIIAANQKLGKHVSWPVFDSAGSYKPTCFHFGSEILNYSGSYVNTVAYSLFEISKGHPRRILRVINNIQATTNWCSMRAAGRKRAAEEIIRQQAKAAQVLRDLALLDQLKNI